MLLSKDELKEVIKKYVTSSDDENAIKDAENISETVDSFDNVDEELRKNDEKWRKKFIEKFFSSNKEDEEKEDEDEEKEDEEEIFIESEVKE